MNPFTMSTVTSRWRLLPRLSIWSVHLAIFVLSGVMAFLLRFEFRISEAHWEHLAVALPIWIAVKSAVFRLLQLDRGWWAQASIPDVLRLAFGNVVGSAAAAAFILPLAPPGFPRSIYLLDLLICTNATGAVRVLTRSLRLFAGHARSGDDAARVIIYGAGDAGVMLLRELRSNPRLNYEVVGFVDDDSVKKGMRVQLIPVLGTGQDLPAIAARQRISEVLIAIPSASGPQMAAILQRCHGAGLKCKTIPGLAEVIEGPGVLNQIRDVAVEDLLGRTPISLDESAIRASIEDKVILVTGAAGSIGSELCRQIARFRPRAIVGYEIAETALFHIEREMRELFPDMPFHPEIGSIQNQRRLDEVLNAWRPSVLYHAAAYKHVPLMESHLFEAVENNVFGTCNVALAAAEYGLDQFVMISSDKAVRPTNIMGLTKRVAELLVNSLQNGGTKFVSVRFGNVLGSNGSVVPLFKKQIAAGGPVTVTHPAMRRYFMTIPEAAQLVLQASTMGKGGEIFVLDMGRPVKIVDLATNLILLSGLRPNEDIKIEFTGIRPGEKLYEELTTLGENTLPTYHEKIRIFSLPPAPEEEMLTHMQSLRRHAAERDAKAIFLELKELVPEYNPSTPLLRRLFGEERKTVLTA
jgi:FlaA1/EpsC-like NDP-sugar epimerase